MRLVALSIVFSALFLLGCAGGGEEGAGGAGGGGHADGGSGGDPGSGGKGGEGEGGEGGAGGAGGEGGAGGAGGGGGEGGAGGEGGGPPDPGPGWDDVAFVEAWRHQGFEKVWSMAVADFLGDGGEQIAIGGRRPLLISGDGKELIWRVDWDDFESNLKGGDNDWAYDVMAVARDGGGFDLLITTSEGEAWRLDGRDGSRVWKEKLAVSLTAPDLLLLGDPADPLFFTRYGHAARSVATGAEVWTLPAPEAPYVHALEAGMGAEAFPGLFLLTEGQSRFNRQGQIIWTSFPTFSSIDSEGTERFRVEFHDGDMGMQPSALGAADLDGDGRHSPIVAFHEYPLQAFDPDGTPRWSYDWQRWPGKTRITRILGSDLNGDGVDELVLIGCESSGCTGSEGEGSVLVLSREGEKLFEIDFIGQPKGSLIAQVDEGAPILFLGLGAKLLSDPKGFLALRLAKLPKDEAVLFEVPLRAAPIELARLGAGGASTVIAGTEDGLLRAFDREGALVWTHHLGDFFSEIAAIPQQGGDDLVVVGDISGTLSLLDTEGRRLWHRTLEVGTHGRVQGLAAARMGAGGKHAVVAIGNAESECCRGTLEVFDLEGERLLAAGLEGRPLALGVSDLDGDGRDEIILVQGMSFGRDACAVRVFETKFGLPLWDTPIEGCEYAELTVGVMDDSGSPSIGVKTHPALLPFPHTRAMLSRDGSLRWKTIESTEAAIWLAASPHGLVIGGEAKQKMGVVALLDPWDGSFVWREELDRGPDPDVPGYEVAGTSQDGIAFEHQGRSLVAASNIPNRVHLFDGATGALLWVSETEDPESGERHRGGPLAYVPQTERTPAHLVFAQDAAARRRGRAMAFSLDGEVKRDLPILSPATRIVVRGTERGTPSVVVKTLLGVHSMELRP